MEFYVVRVPDSKAAVGPAGYCIIPGLYVLTLNCKQTIMTKLVDGIIVKGNTSLDTSALTGESELVYVQEKSSVLSGSINIGNVIEIKATSLFENSTVSKILELLEDATDKKTKTETTIAKIIATNI